MLSVNYVHVLFMDLLWSISWHLNAVINKNVTTIVAVLVLLRETYTNDYALFIYKNKDKCSDGLKKKRAIKEQ